MVSILSANGIAGISFQLAAMEAEESSYIFSGTMNKL